MPATAASTHARSRRAFRRLEPPQVLLLLLLLTVVDVAALITTNIVARGIGCSSVACENAHAASTAGAWVTLVIAVAVIVVPIGAALVRRVGVRTVAITQLIVGALLVVHAAGFISDAGQARDRPPATPTTLRTVPCAERTLSGFLCISQPPASGGN